MKSYIQKNIMINPELWENAKLFAETVKGENISSVIRKALKSYLEKESENNLAYKMRIYATGFVDDDEQQEIEEILSSMTKEDFETGEIIEL